MFSFGKMWAVFLFSSMINIADYKGFYLQKGTDTVKESNAEWGIVVQKFDWSCMMLKPKEYASTDFKDQNGKDTFVPQVIKFESGTMKLTFLYIGAYNTFYQKLVEFQTYLANGGEFKFQDKFSGVGRQKVRWTDSDAPNMISKSEGEGDTFTFGMTFVFDDPVTNIVLAPLSLNTISVSFGEPTENHVPIIFNSALTVASDILITISGSITQNITITRGDSLVSIDSIMGGEEVLLSISPESDDVYKYMIQDKITIPSLVIPKPENTIIATASIGAQGNNINISVVSQYPVNTNLDVWMKIGSYATNIAIYRGQSSGSDTTNISNVGKEAKFYFKQGEVNVDHIEDDVYVYRMKEGIVVLPQLQS